MSIPGTYLERYVEVRDALTGAALPAAWAKLVGDPDTLPRGQRGLPFVRISRFGRPARLEVGLHGYKTLTTTVTSDRIDPAVPRISPILVFTLPRQLVGKVTRGLDGTPLAGVRVSAEGASTTTDSLGRFELYDRCGTRSSLRAESSGLPYSLLDVRAGGGDTALVNIALYPSTPKGAITGKVANPKTRRPMARALVGISGQDLPSLTDSLGQFEFVGLPPGSYTVRLYTRLEDSWADPGLTELEVKPAETTRVELRYYDGPRPPDDSNYPSVVRVVVRDALTGKPTRGASVGVAGSGSWLKVNGSGSVTVPTGTSAAALIVAAAPGYGPSIGMWQRCNGDTAVVTADLWPARPMTLIGELINEDDGSRLGDATVWVGDRSSRTDSRGRFTLTTRLGPQTAFSTGVRGLLYVTPRFRKLAGDTVHLTLRASSVFHGATVLGRVRDARYLEGLAGASVVIVGTDLGSDTDADGRYHIEGVPQGSYRAVASYMGYEDAISLPSMAVPGGTDTLDFRLRERRLGN